MYHFIRKFGTFHLRIIPKIDVAYDQTIEIFRKTLRKLFVHDVTIKFINSYVGQYFEVQAGILRQNSFSPMSQSRKARYTVMYSQYNARHLQNDIGMIMLDDPLRFNRWVRPVCLPGPNLLGPMWRNKPEPNTTCIAIGWGTTAEYGLNRKTFPFGLNFINFL